MTIIGISSFATDTGRKTPVLAEKDASIGRKCQKCACVTAALVVQSLSSPFLPPSLKEKTECSLISGFVTNNVAQPVNLPDPNHVRFW